MTSKTELLGLIGQATFEYMRAIKEHMDANLAYIEAKKDLERKIAVAMYNGEIVGKNEKEREGAAYVMFESEYKLLDSTMRGEIIKRAEVRVSEAEVEMYKLTARIEGEQW